LKAEAARPVRRINEFHPEASSQLGEFAAMAKTAR
jgi:hypothetical protein